MPSIKWPADSTRRTIVIALILAAWTVLAYAPALPGAFFFDDEFFVEKNQLVHSLASLPRLYVTSVTETPAMQGGFYRPNQQLCYALIYGLVGLASTVPYHLLSVLLHTLNGALLMAWLLALGGSGLGAAVGAAIFLLHPAQTEAVAYISGLADPLALAFMLGALVVYTRALRAGDARRLWRRLPVVVVLAVLAALTKENGVVLAPALLLVTLYAWRQGWPETRGPAAATVAASALIALAYSLFKMRSLAAGIGLAREANVYTESLAMRLQTFVADLPEYVRLVLYPRDLYYEKPYRAYASLANLRGALGGATLLAAAGAAVLGARRAPRLALAVTLTAAALIPYSGIVPLNAMWLEHWLYVPMLGIAMLGGLAGEWLARRGARTRLAAAGLFAVVVALWTARTAARAAEWADPEAFYLNEIAHGGTSVRVLNNLGMWYSDHGDAEKSIYYYRLATQATAGFPEPHHNLARAYLAAGRVPEALSELRQVIRIAPGFTYSLALLEEVFTRTGDVRRAQAAQAVMAAVQRGERLDPAAEENALFGGLSLP